MSKDYLCQADSSGSGEPVSASPLQSVPEWMPIETAPMGASGKPETYFIGGRLDTGGRINTATCYRNQYGAYEWWGGGLTPTHWMPIPPLPQRPQTQIEEPGTGDTDGAEQREAGLTQKIEESNA